MVSSRRQTDQAQHVLPPIIHVVDDDASFRTAIRSLLCACDYRVALHASAEALLATPLMDEPACILLDVRMAGCSGPQLQSKLVELGHRLPVIFVTGYSDVPTAVRAIKAGAEDVLTKPVARQRLLDAIARALAHRAEMRDRAQRIDGLRALVSRLTAREHEVFALLARGKPHKQIAYALGTSERTVKFHRHNILQKCEAHSLADLAVIADRLGLLATPAAVEPEASPQTMSRA
jgi:FixJ family two-component response regulator